MMRGEFEIEAPAVLLEVCGTFVADPEEAGICAACGWLEDDHVVVHVEEIGALTIEQLEHVARQNVKQ